MSGLTPEQQGMLQSFQEIAQIDDEYLCIQILQENNWNLDVSIAHFVSPDENQSPMDNMTTSSSSSSSGSRNSSSSGNNNDYDFHGNAINDTGDNNDNNNNVVTTAPADYNDNITGNNSSSVTTSGGLFDILLLPIRWLLQPGSVDTNPNLDTENFISEFDEKYGSAHPPFHRSSYMSAVANSFTGSRFVMVYLHSPIHEDSDKFCTDVLCSQTMQTFVETNQITTWVGKVWDTEAYGLSTQLQTAAYPFVALLVCQSDRVVEVAQRVQGYVDETALVEKLNAGVSSFSAVIERNRAEANRRVEAVRLREQQDREYRESAEADRLERDRVRVEQEARAAAEAAVREAEAQRELEETSRLRDRDSFIQQRREVLQGATEPAAGPDVAVVRFQLPSGKKVTRKFHKTDQAQLIFDFLLVHFVDVDGNFDMQFSVSTHFPKMELTDMEQTVEDLSLFPRGVLYVQDLNS